MIFKVVVVECGQDVTTATQGNSSQRRLYRGGNQSKQPDQRRKSNRQGGLGERWAVVGFPSSSVDPSSRSPSNWIMFRNYKSFQG